MKALVKAIISIALFVLILTSCHGFSSITQTPSPKDVMETAISVASTMVAETQMALPVPPTPQVIKSPSLTPAEIANQEDQFVLPNQWDGGLFSEGPCRAPCFAGLVPGTTTETEAIVLIQESDYFQNCTLEDRRDQGRWISCNGLIININKANSIVDGVGFGTHQQFSIEDIISKYGAPTQSWLVWRAPYAPEVSMVVFWEEDKFRVNLEVQEGFDYQLEPSTIVTNIVYYSKAYDGFERHFQDWHGYGEYIVDND